MKWLEGVIVGFAGNDPKKAELRKIRTHADQDWNEMYYFHVALAHDAGYPNAALTPGQTIEFIGKQGPRGPRVERFKPYARSEGGPRRTPAGDRFLNPYHFIPLHLPVEGTLRPAEKVLDEGVLHHRFGSPSPPPSSSDPPLYSGRILCRLETEGPVVIGAAQDAPTAGEDRETVVSPFELPDPARGTTARRRPAIPGSSLRGLISSLVEAASCSAMRVLDDASYTRRALVGKGAAEGLSAIGMLVREEGALKLHPLAMSLDEMKRLSGEPPETGCRVLVGEYRSRGDRLEPVPDSFLERAPLSWSASNQDEFWYCDTRDAEWHPRESGMKIGILPKRPPISERDWKKLDEAERQSYTRGVLMVVGLEGSKAENLPKNKKFEFFLPYPEDEADPEGTLGIEPEALKELKDLLQDAAHLPRGGQDQDYPYLHRGRKRDSGWLEPRAGDLVYYKRNEKTRRVCRLAYTAIWRRPVRGGLWSAISSLASPHLVPLHPGRDQLTVAERLFGFVEKCTESDRPKGERRPARALASRVRFSHALGIGDEPEDGWYEPEVTLKILASPKPPSPALYFGNETNGKGEALAKNELHLAKHVPQGRKAYLHHRKEAVEALGYATGEPDKNRKQKLRVRPLRTGTGFLFHLDFHNLERAELGLLLYALRPRQSFRHKLGLGKPIGLGRVRIDPLAVAHIDRPAWYRPEGLFGARYAAVEWLDDSIHWGEAGETLRLRYRDLREGVSGEGAASGIFPVRSVLAEEARASVPPTVRNAIEQLGDPDQVDLEVTYPVVAGQDAEGEHFKWFVENDRSGNRQRLEPVTPGEPLPTLERYRERRKGRGGGQPRD